MRSMYERGHHTWTLKLHRSLLRCPRVDRCREQKQTVFEREGREDTGDGWISRVCNVSQLKVAYVEHIFIIIVVWLSHDRLSDCSAADDVRLQCDGR
jgi:hypothetical protein